MFRIKKFIDNPTQFLIFLSKKRLLCWLPDKYLLKLLFRGFLGYWPDFDNPKTFNEKLNWLKLNDRNPLYTSLVDKAKVKEIVADKIGKQYVIPTIGVWNSFDEIDFDKLPNQFVIKCTHDSKSVMICKDKSKFDKKKAGKKIKSCLKTNLYWCMREWPYKNVKPRVIVEKLMENSDGCSLVDYKFFCFNGEAKIVFTVSGRENGTPCADYFDTNWNVLPFEQGFPRSSFDNIPRKPRSLERMICLAQKLSENIPQVRVDFYEIDGEPYFGEMTFFDSSGLAVFSPREWDFKLGEMIKLE